MDENTNKLNTSWEAPEIKELGNAKDIVKNQNVVGGGDIEFSVINPS